MTMNNESTSCRHKFLPNTATTRKTTAFWRPKCRLCIELFLSLFSFQAPFVFFPARKIKHATCLPVPFPCVPSSVASHVNSCTINNGCQSPIEAKPFALVFSKWHSFLIFFSKPRRAERVSNVIVRFRFFFARTAANKLHLIGHNLSRIPFAAVLRFP